MFLSKIWFFLVTVAAALAITIALVMPRPAERAAIVSENKRVRRACHVANILLRDNARARIQLTSEFAQAVRQLKLSDTLLEASRGEIVSGEANATGRKELTKLLESVSGTKPSFIWLLDQRGRVVARSNLDDTTYGDSMRGYFLVQDALNGYVRDDLWSLEDGLYRVSAAPVLTRQLAYAGAIVLGQAVDQDFAASLGENVDANVSFYVKDHPVASSNPVQIHADVTKGLAALQSLEFGHDCSESDILQAKAGSDTYSVINARLPGEAGMQGAFYSVFVEQEKARGFMGTLKAAKKDDLGFGRFPWIPVALAFVGFVGIGFFFQHLEVTGPLKKLGKDAVALAQDEKDRFNEEMHRGKYGSIARSVNIAIDKMQRETKAAKREMDQLLGPAPDADGGDALGSALPPISPGGSGADKSPPPSEFKFGGKPATPGVAAEPAGGLGLDLTPPPPSTGGLDLTPPPPSTPAATPKPPVPTPKPKVSKDPADKTPPPIPVKKAGAGGPDLKRPTDSQVVPDPVSLPDLGASIGESGGKKTIDDDVLGADDSMDAPTQLFEGSSPSAEMEEMPTQEGDDDSYYRQVFEKFIALKKECGEKTENLTFERFRAKLQKNRDALVAKHNCKSVKFQVYEKDGKAALKASPVK